MQLCNELQYLNPIVHATLII